MSVDDIKTRPIKGLKFGRGKVRNLSKFDAVVAKYKAEKEALDLEGVLEYMGKTLHTVRSYAKERNLKMKVMRDDKDKTWIIFE